MDHAQHCHQLSFRRQSHANEIWTMVVLVWRKSKCFSTVHHMSHLGNVIVFCVFEIFKCYH